MRLPDEIVAESVAPTLRALLAESLLRRKLSQQEIADILGVSQSAVSKHLGGRFRTEPLVASDPRVRAVVADLTEGLATRRLSKFEALARTMDLVRTLENRGPVCTLHERESPELRGLGCDLCVRLHQSPVKAEEEVLANVREAVRVLTASPSLAPHLPSVGSNVAMVLRGATDPNAVAAVPGGLFEARGIVRAPAPPEFGVSRTVALVLLGAHAARPAIRGCVNLAPSPALSAAAHRAGLAVVAMDASDERDPAAVARRVGSAKSIDVLVHEGAFGVEAVAYVLGESALDAATKALTLVARDESMR